MIEKMNIIIIFILLTLIIIIIIIIFILIHPSARRLVRIRLAPAFQLLSLASATPPSVWVYGERLTDIHMHVTLVSVTTIIITKTIIIIKVIYGFNGISH